MTGHWREIVHPGNPDPERAAVCLECKLDPDACLAETETRCPFATSHRQSNPCWNREWLYTEYIAKGRSAADIAAEVGLSVGGVVHWIRKHGLCRNRAKELP